MGVYAFQSGISGLQASDQWLDSIANNLANVNTTGYKASQAQFADRLSQALQAPQGPGNGMGGTDPIQVGLGTRLSEMRTLFTQGPLLETGNPLDAAIEGNGFFQVRNGSQTFLTRAGNFQLDGAGFLVDASGNRVMGANAIYQTQTNVISSGSGFLLQPLLAKQVTYGVPDNVPAAFQEIRIPPNTTLPPKATTEVKFQGNLDAGQRATEPGGIFNLGTFFQPVLPIAINIYGYPPGIAIDTTRLDVTFIPGGFAFHQIQNISSTTAYPILNGGIDIQIAQALAGNYAWEQQPPQPPACSLNTTVYDSTGGPREITVQFYQVNDLGDGGINPPAGPSQAVWAWYAFDTTGGKPVSTANLVGGTGIIEGDDLPPFGLWYYDRGINNNLYMGDFIWFNTDGSLASSGGSGGPIPTPPGTPNFQCIPRIYLPPTNTNPAIAPIPTQGADIMSIDLNFGTAGLITDGRRDGLTCDASGIQKMENGVLKYEPQSTAYVSSQNGYQEGRLKSLDWDTQGNLMGHFDNGQNTTMARLGMVAVDNPGGLSKTGSNTYGITANSGSARNGYSGSAGLGSVRGGTLEGSNVDLPTELSAMIIAQRGFQANARTIAAASKMEQTRINIGR